MNYLSIIAGSIIVIFSIYLISLPLAAFRYRQAAVRYFSAFASSARAHYVEQVLRLVVGVSLLIFSDFMLYGKVFETFAWIIIGSTIVLIIVPWTWHNKLGKRIIPLTIRNLKFYAVSAGVFGSFILYCVAAPVLRK